VENHPRGQKDVVYTCLVGNGTVSKLYIETTKGVSFTTSDLHVSILPSMGNKKVGARGLLTGEQQLLFFDTILVV
jgi:hypothetical protein